jgi:Raf kinase inhibitor-like YbhB/YbcL family protein
MMPKGLLAACIVCLSWVACGDGAVPTDVSPDPDASAADAADTTPTPDGESPKRDAGDAAIDAPAGPLTLTSSALNQGASIASVYTCAGTNVSLPLSWSGGTGAKSYAVVLLDVSNNNIHWVIWDIPTATTSLPEALEKKANPASPPGAKQALSYDGTTNGYLGPCPGGSVHTYEWTVYAMDVATLPGVNTTSKRADVRAAVIAHNVASAKLSGTSNAKK